MKKILLLIPLLLYFTLSCKREQQCKIFKTNYLSGDIKLRYGLDKDSLKCGSYQEYFENGEVKVTREYEKDTIIGVEKEYDEQGNLIKKYIYEQGERIKEIGYYRSGKKNYEAELRNGIPWGNTYSLSTNQDTVEIARLFNDSIDFLLEWDKKGDLITNRRRVILNLDSLKIKSELNYTRYLDVDSCIHIYTIQDKEEYQIWNKKIYPKNTYKSTIDNIYLDSAYYLSVVHFYYLKGNPNPKLFVGKTIKLK